MRSVTSMPRMRDVSLVACIALFPSPAWRSARHLALTLKSQEAQKTCLDQVPSEFPCLKHHRPAQNAPSAQEYHASCSTEIGGGAEAVKPCIRNQSPESCRFGWSKIWVWITFDKQSYRARFWVHSPSVRVLYSVKGEPKSPTATSPAWPPCHPGYRHFQVLLDISMSFHHSLHHPTLWKATSLRTGFAPKNMRIPDKGK